MGTPAESDGDPFALENKDLDDELRKIQAENERGRTIEDDAPLPVRQNAGVTGGGPGVQPANIGDRKKPKKKWLPEHEWHVVGQNPPDYEKKPPNPVYDALRKVRKDYVEAMRHIDSPGYAARLAQIEAYAPMEVEKPKQNQPTYQHGPTSPSMHVRAPPEWAVRVEGEEMYGSPDADRARPREGGLYYPSSPLVTGRAHRMDPYAAHRERPSEDEALRYIQQERQRIQQAAYDFYRTNGRVPNLPQHLPRSPVEDSVQQVLAGTYASPGAATDVYNTPRNRNTPAKSSYSPGTHHVLTPSVHLAYSPRADPKPSDIFYPR